MTTYEELRRNWSALRPGMVPKSICFRRDGSFFSNLYMPKRAKGKSTNGGFMRAPRTERS